jgi:hypothetical protein
MGWCSATEIMDWAIQMADLAVEEALGDAPDEETQARVEERIRSRVACLARKLHDNDWDCEQDSDFFDRFPQEMLDYDDARFAEWLRNELVYETNPERIRDLSGRLALLAEAA